MIDEDLSFILKSAECGRVNNAIAVALKTGARRAFRLIMHTPTALFRDAGIDH